MLLYRCARTLRRPQRGGAGGDALRDEPVDVGEVRGLTPIDPVYVCVYIYIYIYI